MTGGRVMENDIVYIKEQSMVANGEIGAVLIEDKIILRHIYYSKEENRLILQAQNPQYPPLIFSNGELDKVEILGKAVAFQSKL